MEDSTSKRTFDEGGRFFGPRYRDFSVAVGGVEVLHYAGVDATLDDVVRQRQAMLTRAWQSAGRPHYANFLPRPDEVVWEGGEVQAVLLPKATGAKFSPELVVYRYDQAFEKGYNRCEKVPVEKPAKAKAKPSRNGRARAPRPTIAVDRDGKGVAS